MSEPDEYIWIRRDDLSNFIAERARKAYEQRAEQQWLKSKARRVLFGLFASAVLIFAVLASGYLVWFEAPKDSCVIVRTERTTTRSTNDSIERFESSTCTPHARAVPLWLGISLAPTVLVLIAVELVMRRKRVEIDVGPVHVKFGTDAAVQALEEEVAADDALRIYTAGES